MTEAGEATQLVALGLLDLAPGVVRRHLVGLVGHDQVPVGRLELGLELLVPREVVESGDEERLLTEWVASARRLDHVFGQDLEAEAELLPQLVLPLLDEAARGDDQAAFDVASDHQLLAEQAGHDRLARPRVICQQVAEGLAGQHLRVHGIDLVR